MPKVKLRPKENIKIKSKIGAPSFYKVIVLNDDFTPVDFVIEVLMVLFHKAREEAIQLAFQVYEEGEGVCGVYSLEVAETKTAELIEWARREQYPLQCRIEKV